MTHPKLVETMSKPEFYPHMPERVELIQTHASYIFIAGDCVYKVKKAVDFGFLDFTDLDKRKYFCHEELRLNQRLAPETYLEVVGIGEDVGGNIVLGRGEHIVEYAVKMRKLPQERMLKKLLAAGEVDVSIMEAIARKLVDFHRNAATGDRINLTGGIETIRRNHDENFAQTKPYLEITIPEYQYRFIKSYADDFMDKKEALFRKRVADHKIRDCHGDLHLEHICITDSIVIFDCIEFNERFRFEDVAAEVAFLVMDLDYNGYTEYADAFVRAYIGYAGDGDIHTLLNFYRCYYAYVRGKVTSFMIDDKTMREEGRRVAVEAASRYFDLAYTYAARLEKPTLILMAGLMGTGKSVLARNIAPRLGAEVIRTDVLRKKIFHLAPTERHYEDFGKGIYSDEVSRRTYEKALAIACEKLQEGRSVIIDASYKRREERMKAARAAEKALADFFVIECICPEEVIKERLHARTSDSDETSDGRWELFQTQKGDFDEITEIPEKNHLIIDTSPKPEESAQRTIWQIKRKEARGKRR
ncbi:MAG: AAA family ATPase [Syntrophales bacterium]|nr:AAA family ATPase [Syntrophales bacterium]